MLGDDRVGSAEEERGDQGHPGVAEVGDHAEAHPPDGEAPPVPGRHADLGDHLKSAMLDRLEGQAGLVFPDVVSHVVRHPSLTFLIGKSFPTFRVGKSRWWRPTW